MLTSAYMYNAMIKHWTPKNGYTCAEDDSYTQIQTNVRMSSRNEWWLDKDTPDISDKGKNVLGIYAYISNWPRESIEVTPIT